MLKSWFYVAEEDRRAWTDQVVEASYDALVRNGRLPQPERRKILP